MDERMTITETEAGQRSRRIAERFRAAAADAGLVDVGVGTLDSPIGKLFVAVTTRGLATIAFEDEDRDELEGHDRERQQREARGELEHDREHRDEREQRLEDRQADAHEQRLEAEGVAIDAIDRVATTHWR